MNKGVLQLALIGSLLACLFTGFGGWAIFFAVLLVLS
jgi:hypothetical protein